MALHELGHSLGLGHSSDSHNSIMFPYYKPGPVGDAGDAAGAAVSFHAGHHLGYDDVIAMYNLYSECAGGGGGGGGVSPPPTIIHDALMIIMQIN